ILKIDDHQQLTKQNYNQKKIGRSKNLGIVKVKEHLESLKNQDEEMEVVRENLPEETIAVPVNVIIQEDAGSSSQINKRCIKTNEELEILK
ncbi:5541_t:CDS:1, partial [Entrophospora sp. SA101]